MEISSQSFSQCLNCFWVLYYLHLIMPSCGLSCSTTQPNHFFNHPLLIEHHPLLIIDLLHHRRSHFLFIIHRTVSHLHLLPPLIIINAAFSTF